jgi:hypothetical protein
VGALDVTLNGPTKSDDQPRRLVAVLIAGAIILLPVAYVLSVGPANWLYNHGPISQPAKDLITHVYWPLGWLCDHCKPFFDVLAWYIDFWK